MIDIKKVRNALDNVMEAIATNLGYKTRLEYSKLRDALNYDTDLCNIKEALNELERLQKFKATFDAYELAKKQDFIAYENWLETEKELNELKSDVNRLLQLHRKVMAVGIDTIEAKEYDLLKFKLSKVGDEK